MARLLRLACCGLLGSASAAAASGGYGGLAASLPGAGAPAVAALLTRRGLNAQLFELSIAPPAAAVPDANDAASFVITNAPAGRIAIAGTDAVALASGARWYLAHYANASFSLVGRQRPFHSRVGPAAAGARQRRASGHQLRHALLLQRLRVWV